MRVMSMIRVLSFTTVAIIALAGFDANAQASGKRSVSGDQTPKLVAVATKKSNVGRTARRARKTTRRRARKRVARKQVTRRVRSTRSRKRSARRGGTLRGLASFYWQPQRVASGGWFNPNALTAAHKSLPFGTRVRVTNLRNGRSVVVRINDRGPYIRGRIIDLSRRAAGVIGMRRSGVVPVRVDIL